MDTNIRHKVLLWRICKRPIGGLAIWITCQFNGEATQEVVEKAQEINNDIEERLRMMSKHPVMREHPEEFSLFIKPQEISSQEDPNCEMNCQGCEALKHIAL